MKLFIAEKPSLARAIAQALLPTETVKICSAKASSTAKPSSSGKQGGYYMGAQGERVTWCVGHLLEQAEPHHYNPAFKRWLLADLPILPSVWKLHPKAQTRQQLNNISRLLSSATEIIHVGDPDREGQLLVDQVLHFLGVGEKVARGVPVMRLLVQDLNPDAISAALRSLKPNSEFSALSTCALARQRADWLYGINMTRAYTLLGRRHGYSGLLSVGRVQTPVLGLVVRRDREIANFQPKPFFEVLAHLETSLPLDQSDDKKLIQTGLADAEGFCARWVPSAACQDHQDDQGRVLNKRLAEHVARRVTGQVAHVLSVKAQKRQAAPPLPYSLSVLQVDLGKRYGFSAQKVLDCAQSLYERHKLITYPRSDCRYLPQAHFALAQGVSDAVGVHIQQLIDWLQHGGATLKGLGPNDDAVIESLTRLVREADLSHKSSVWDDKRVGAHHAIIPTARKAQMMRLTVEERLVYETVARQYMLQFFPPYQYQDTEVMISIAGGQFKAQAQKALKLGWHSVVGVENKNKQLLPTLRQGQALWSRQGEVVEKTTSPPSHFTDATLIQAMTGIARFVESKSVRQVLRETDGLGTEATRAGIVELLVNRGFLIRRGRQILSSPSGSALIDVLPREATLPDMTAQWEAQLGEISRDKTLYQHFMQTLTQQLKDFVAQVNRDTPASISAFAALPVPPERFGNRKRGQIKTKKRVQEARGRGNRRKPGGA